LIRRKAIPLKKARCDICATLFSMEISLGVSDEHAFTVRRSRAVLDQLQDAVAEERHPSRIRDQREADTYQRQDTGYSSAN
jgi:hypothetical protein